MDWEFAPFETKDDFFLQLKIIQLIIQRMDIRSICRENLGKYIDEEKAEIIEERLYTYSARVALEKGERGFHEELYCDKARTLLNNLDPESHVKNGWFSKKINEMSEKDLRILDVCHLLLEEIFPARWESIIEENRLKEEKRKERMKQEGYYKCFRCGSKHTTYQVAQLRSCDEPMSILVLCMDCGQKWRG